VRAEGVDGSVDLAIATDGTAKGSVLVNGGELVFTNH
jgi:hypothetical protein